MKKKKKKTAIFVTIKSDLIGHNTLKHFFNFSVSFIDFSRIYPAIVHDNLYWQVAFKSSEKK